MTTPHERTRALVAAGEFLETLLAAGPGEVPAILREEARHILRHYPSNREIAWMAESCQHFDPMQLLDSTAVPTELRKGFRR